MSDDECISLFYEDRYGREAKTDAKSVASRPPQQAMTAHVKPVVVVRASGQSHVSKL